MRKIIIALVALVLAVGATHADAAMSEKQARDKAIEVLMGVPYRHIQSAELPSDGKTLACGTAKKLVWQFHVVVEKPVNNPGQRVGFG